MKKSFILLAIAISIFMSMKALAEEMTISAAASLTNAFNELAAIFEKDNPGLKVYTNYAASNPLLKQIVEGAPVDVFASADQATMNQAEEAKVIDAATRKTFALNDLALIVPAGNSKPASLEDLRKLDKIAIGDPASVPAGRYTELALKKAGLWTPLEKKFILASSVRQALEYVASGEVDAGFVYGTDAKQMGSKVETAFTVPLNSPVSYPVAVVVTGHNPQAGARFIDFILSAPAQKILNDYGFVSSK